MKIATSMNDYDWYATRATEECPHAPEWCVVIRPLLVEWQKHIHEAEKADKWGGKAPLQMKQLKTDEKAVKRVY